MTTLELDWTGNAAPLEVVRTLRRAGHEAWLAGGCVRDLLLRRVPKDHDIATSATPAQVAEAFRRTVPVQPELGVTLVLWGEERLEVTTFRSEGPYLDGRHPSRVGPADALQDVLRRDFTVNGMLLDPETGEIADHVGGLDDLRSGILRCIGSAHDRFSEDHLRILRAVRFAVRFGLRIENDTWEAMRELSPHTSRLSGERLRDELDRMFAQGPFARCLELLQGAGILATLLPELSAHLDEAGTLERHLAWLQAVPDPAAGVWPALLCLPLASWWPAPFAGGAKADIPVGLESLLGLLRSSRAESEGARFALARWPEAWIATPRRPSELAPLARDRNLPALLGLLTQARTSSVEAPFDAGARLAAAMAPIPPAPPALGDALMACGVPRGPRLGEAIRLADRLCLDEGREPGDALAAEVAKTILETT